MSPVYDKGPGGGYWYYLVPIAIMIAIVLIWLATAPRASSSDWRSGSAESGAALTTTR